jgi:hypothetical protein
MPLSVILMGAVVAVLLLGAAYIDSDKDRWKLP